VTTDRAGGRVLFMSAGRIFGGAERSMVSTAKRLSAFGWDVIITTSDGPLAKQAAALGLQVLPRPWRTIRGISDKSSGVKKYSFGGMTASVRDTVVNAIQLARLIREVRPDVVVSNSLPTHLVVAVAGRLSRTPSAWYLRDIVDPGRGRRVLEIVGRLVDVMISISAAVTASLTHPRIVAVPNPIEPPPSDAEPMALPHTGRPVLGYLGRLDPRKGVEDLLHAAGRLDVDVVVVGEPVLATPDYIREVHDLADRVAPDRVRFVGQVPTPWPALLAMDVLVVPSRREPWGRVAAEALTVGVPVVAADAGGLPEIVRHGVDGFLYPPGDVDALVARLHTLLDDASVMATFSQAALDGATRFHPDHNTHLVAGVLESAVSRRSTSRRHRRGRR
jgi:glycosyltransferase involved in cell wall biosynthesis